MIIKYDNHKTLWDNLVKNKKKKLSSELWFKSDSLDSWRHERIKKKILPILKLNKTKKWLTVGDGRYGNEAHFLIKNGVLDVTASDITDSLLKIAQKNNFISKYSIQNAEKINYKNNQFDLTYCKETFHHLPRPYIGLYEMIRVSKKAVILTEPHDRRNNFIIKLLKKFLQKKNDYHVFEDVGNYVYSLSITEIEKIMLGIGLKYYAYLGINDYYINGVEKIPKIGGNLRDFIFRLKLKSIITLKNILTKFKISNYNIITVVIFKSKPTKNEFKELKKHGYTIRNLPSNPFRK